ncbi:uncharacterized protein MONBRDRAFT_22689 [Monosiga brevicollis MX1]|uniref:UBA domain-containing protein n=1 Tax=Monosiga brevicollis TaxID=81824 RepID=A9URS6_MONBE|nr:uncharacterized protein MONBRDRAFT_22689 [Monosiga brevicollis MX1]EDQ91979.1 predicted protein [Monosiga brevicollis MX1]|eukprot:XP_001743265.1 hypothetical protein [Monosiga brevicollis MX1]
MDHHVSLLLVRGLYLLGGWACGVFISIGHPGCAMQFQQQLEHIIQLIFVPNKGELIVVTQSATLYQWRWAEDPPRLINSLAFKHEELTFVHLAPGGDGWLYVGTNRGNVYLIRSDTLVRSTYAIMWNEVTTKYALTYHRISGACPYPICTDSMLTSSIPNSPHFSGFNPGPVIKIASQPGNTSTLLLVYERGYLATWNVMERQVLDRFKMKENAVATSACWAPDGKFFYTGHVNGDIMRWDAKKPLPEQVQTEEDFSFREPVLHMSALQTKGGLLLAHDGGPAPLDGQAHTLSILMPDGRVRNSFLDNDVMDILLLSDGPKGASADTLVLLTSDKLQVLDVDAHLASIDVMHGLQVQDSVLTCSQHISSPGAAVFNALVLAARDEHMHQGQATPTSPRSARSPINGGSQRGSTTPPFGDLLITGHADGSVLFWNWATGLMTFLPAKILPDDVILVHKLRLPYSPEHVTLMPYGDDRAVMHVVFDVTKLLLAVSHASGHVLVYQFSTQAGPTEFELRRVQLLEPSGSPHSSRSQSPSKTRPPRPPAPEGRVPMAQEQSKREVAGNTSVTDSDNVVSEAKVKELMEYGFSEASVRAELATTKGDMNQAAANLFDREDDRGHVANPKASKEQQQGARGADHAGATDSDTAIIVLSDGQQLVETSELDHPVSAAAPESGPSAPESGPSATAQKDAGDDVRTQDEAGGNDAGVESEEEYKLPLASLPDSTVLSYQAHAGFQLYLAAICTVMGQEHDEVVDHVACLELYAHRGVLCFGNTRGVCMLSFVAPRCQVKAELSLHHPSRENREADGVCALSAVPGVILRTKEADSIQAPAVLLVATLLGDIYAVPVAESGAAKHYFSLKAPSPIIGLQALDAHHHPLDVQFWGAQEKLEASDARVSLDAETQCQTAKAMPAQDSAAEQATLPATLTELRALLSTAPDLDRMKTYGDHIKHLKEAQKLDEDELHQLRAEWETRRIWLQEHGAESSTTAQQASSNKTPAAEAGAPDGPGNAESTPAGDASLVLAAATAFRKGGLSGSSTQMLNDASVLVVTATGVLCLKKGAVKARTHAVKASPLTRWAYVSVDGVPTVAAVSRDGVYHLYPADNLHGEMQLPTHLPRGLRAVQTLVITQDGSLISPTRSGGLVFKHLINADTAPVREGASGQESADSERSVNCVFDPSRVRKEERQSGGLLSGLFGKKISTATERDELFEKMVDRRDKSHVADRTAHADAAHGGFSELHEKMRKREERLAKFEQQAQQMAAEAENFNSAARFVLCVHA